MQKTLLASFLKGEETWFVKMRRMADSYSALEEMNSKQKAICNSLDEDMKTIKSSFKLKGNYEIVEDPASEEGDQSYLSGYYQDPNSNNGDGEEDSDEKKGEDAEENGETNEENNDDSEENGGGEDDGNGGGADEGNEGGADEGDEGGADEGDEGGADEGAGGEEEGGEDEGSNDG